MFHEPFTRHFRKTRPDMSGRAMLDDLLRYWDQLRQSDKIPARTDLDPARIDQALPYTLMMEMVVPRIAQVRVAGQQVAPLFGQDPRGLPLSMLIKPEMRDTLAVHLECMVRTGQPFEMDLTAPRSLTKPGCAATLMILPLLDMHGNVARAIAAIAGEAPLGTAARRFVIERVRYSDLPASLPARAAPAPRSQPKLRLVVSNV